MADNQVMNVKIDFVLCIDASESMHDMLDKVKKSAMGLYDKLETGFDRTFPKHEFTHYLKDTRVKVIAFRDMTIGEENEVSEWFSLPTQNAEFKAFLDRLEARGGGDGSETAIDAISLAMM
jgi:hypothetical protein